MKQVKGFWLPDKETHLVPFLENGPEFAGGPTYQLRKLLPALQYIKNFRHAVDIGSHCGLWARPLSAMFRHVSAFEPVEAHRECWRKNVTATGTVLWPNAIGERDCNVSLHTGESSSGDTYIAGTGEHLARMRTLDSFGLQDVDFIKLDCEGYEFFSIKGAEQTIKRDRPCVIVEQKPGKGAQFGIKDTSAVDLLKSWGAQLRFEISGDFCLSW